ncbi:transposase [Chloroflexota bacterium]
MSKKRRTYTREFKLDAVRLAETSDESMAQIERNLGISEGCLRKWRSRMAADGENAFPGHGNLPPDQERLRQLERELEMVRQERDILKKAIAIFSRASK